MNLKRTTDTKEQKEEQSALVTFTTLSFYMRISQIFMGFSFRQLRDIAKRLRRLVQWARIFTTLFSITFAELHKKCIVTIPHQIKECV